MIKPKLVAVLLTGLGAAAIVAVAIRASPKLHSPSQTPPCVLNLADIEGSKHHWAKENKKALSDTPTWSDITPYWEFPERSGVRTAYFYFFSTPS